MLLLGGKFRYFVLLLAADNMDFKPFLRKNFAAIITVDFIAWLTCLIYRILNIILDRFLKWIIILVWIIVTAFLLLSFFLMPVLKRLSLSISRFLHDLIIRGSSYDSWLPFSRLMGASRWATITNWWCFPCYSHFKRFPRFARSEMYLQSVREKGSRTIRAWNQGLSVPFTICLLIVSINALGATTSIEELQNSIIFTVVTISKDSGG